MSEVNMFRGANEELGNHMLATQRHLEAVQASLPAIARLVAHSPIQVTGRYNDLRDSIDAATTPKRREPVLEVIQALRPGSSRPQSTGPQLNS